jgi:myo-inositol-1(or 4)-monophosphatase
MTGNRAPGEALAEVINITQGAGEIAAGWFGRVTGTRKSDGSLATEADLASEAFLKERLGQLFPGDEICSEEAPEHRCIGAGRVWSVDPLDGTHNFVAGLGLWAVSVGLIEAGQPRLGVVYSPPLGLTWAAERGAGAWRNGEPLAAPRAAAIERNDLVAVNTDMPFDLRKLPGKKRNTGSAALHACWVVTGILRAAYFYNWALWDLAGALCLAGETGVEARWQDGRRLEDLSPVGASERQGLLVLAPGGLCEQLVEGLGSEGIGAAARPKPATL